MVISQGEVWWADLPAPVGSAPGFRRPVVVVQGDALNRSRISTVVCVPLTSNLRWADAPGNVLLSARLTGLPKDSVANVSQVLTLDRDLLEGRVSFLPPTGLFLLPIDNSEEALFLPRRGPFPLVFPSRGGRLRVSSVALGRALPELAGMMRRKAGWLLGARPEKGPGADCDLTRVWSFARG